MADDKDSSPSSQPTPPSAPESELHPFSCILCKQRKIRCDKHHPCQNCTKARAQCIFRAPAPPRRGKRKPPEANLLARLKRYEDMLQGLGVSIEKLKIDNDDRPRPQDKNNGPMLPRGNLKEYEDSGRLHAQGKLISTAEGTGKAFYVEDNLWTSLSEELKDTPEVLDSSDEGDDAQCTVDRSNYDSLLAVDHLVFGAGGGHTMRIPHPPLEHARKLWEIYRTNFDPITKVIHVPTTEKIIFDALRDTGTIAKNIDSLIYAMYCGAIATLDSSDTLELFGEEQPRMMARFTLAAQHAFVRAGLLRSADLVIVQAFTIFLLANRMILDPRVGHMLTGMNLRLAHRLGIHRDGTHLGLPPFETEMRRRLWWQVFILDTHSAILSGSGSITFHNSWDAKTPLNVNDEDIFPGMQAFPLEREGPTEMFFCLLRHEFGRFFRIAKSLHTPQSIVNMPRKEKNGQIDDVERNIEQRFLRYCDPLSNLHYLAQTAGRCAIASMRLITNLPRFQPDKGASMTRSEHAALFRHALMIVKYDNMSYTDPRIRGYRWHVRAYFQYNAFVYILTELCQHGLGPDVDQAWVQVAAVITNHPEMKGQRALQVAVIRLVCKAWSVRAAALIQAGEQPVPPPGIVDILAMRARAERSADSASGSGSTPASASTSHLTRGASTASTSSGVSPGSIDRLDSLDALAGGQSWASFDTGMNFDQSALGGAAWTGADWGADDFDFNALQNEPMPMDWSAWDQIMQKDAGGAGFGTGLDLGGMGDAGSSGAGAQGMGAAGMGAFGGLSGMALAGGGGLGGGGGEGGGGRGLGQSGVGNVGGNGGMRCNSKNTDGGRNGSMNSDGGARVGGSRDGGTSANKEGAMPASSANLGFGRGGLGGGGVMGMGVAGMPNAPLVDGELERRAWEIDLV